MSDDLENFVDLIYDGDLTSASKAFNDMMQDRMNTALDAEKVKIADKFYNEEEQLEFELENSDDQEEYEETETDEDPESDT